MDAVDRFAEAVPELPAPSPGDPRTLFRRGRRRRRRRHLALASGVTVGIVAVVAASVGLVTGTGPQLPDVADRPDGDLVEQAPDAGAVDAHWPIELIYVQYATEHRFRGTSWADWSVERKVGADSWELVDHERPRPAQGTEDSDAPVDAGSSAAYHDDGFLRAPGAHLISSWRSTTGLSDRAVVELSAIPGGVDLVQRLGLTAEDVEAYVTPNTVGCGGPLGGCVPPGETGARGIAHLPTGFPLFAEEASPGDTSHVYLEARSIRWGDGTVVPSR